MKIGCKSVFLLANALVPARIDYNLNSLLFRILVNDQFQSYRWFACVVMSSNNLMQITDLLQ